MGENQYGHTTIYNTLGTKTRHSVSVVAKNTKVDMMTKRALTSSRMNVTGTMMKLRMTMLYTLIPVVYKFN